MKTANNVTVQAQILELIGEQRRELRLVEHPGEGTAGVSYSAQMAVRQIERRTS